MRDLHHNLAFRRAISPVSVADSTPLVSQIIDTAGFNSLEFAINIGGVADADATFTVLVEDGNAANLSDAAAVADSGLLGTELLAGFQFDDDNEVRSIGYIGYKRYARLTITPVNNASAALLSAMAILGHPASAPTA
jgi:hypothetical protein